MSGETYPATLGSAVEPDIREDVGGDGRAGQRRLTSTEGRRFRCANPGCEASKWVTNPPARESESAIRTGCPDCDAIVRHVPDHGRPLAYYQEGSQ